MKGEDGMVATGFRLCLTCMGLFGILIEGERFRGQGKVWQVLSFASYEAPLSFFKGQEKETLWCPFD